MENFLDGKTEELEAAKRAIIDEAEKNLAADKAASALKAKEKELNAQKMFMSDKTDATIKRSRGELEKNLDGKVRDAERDVKEARKNKKDALSKAVSQRVKEETAELVAENKKLRKENGARLKSAKVPFFCNTKLYFALFVPRSGSDFAVFALSIVIAAALIPNVVCALLEWKTLYKILIYVGIVVFFALIYFLITIWTKAGDKGAALEACRPNMKAIRDNKKTAKKLEKGIRRDSNEGQYGLGGYDDEIAYREGLHAESMAEREAELARFDEITANEIKKEIEDEIMPKIEQLTAEAAALGRENAERKKEAAESTEYLTTNYTLYLGEKYTACDKIDEMIAMINEGKAENVAQALEILKGGNK